MRYIIETKSKTTTSDAASKPGLCRKGLYRRIASSSNVLPWISSSRAACWSPGSWKRSRAYCVTTAWLSLYRVQLIRQVVPPYSPAAAEGYFSTFSFHYYYYYERAACCCCWPKPLNQKSSRHRLLLFSFQLMASSDNVFNALCPFCRPQAPFFFMYTAIWLYRIDERIREIEVLFCAFVLPIERYTFQVVPAGETVEHGALMQHIQINVCIINTTQFYGDYLCFLGYTV